MSAINEIEDEEKQKDKPLVEEEKEAVGDISSKKIKLLYIITVGGVLLIVVLVAIIVIFLGNNISENENPNEDNNNKDNETIPDYDPDIDPYINSSFIAFYQTSSGGEEVKLFNEYIIDKISLMQVDNETINLANISNIYKFNSIGDHKVII